MDHLPPSSPTGLLPAFRPEYSKGGDVLPDDHHQLLSSPPGSPIQEDDNDDKLPPLRTFYPTPLPSSSVGDGRSSPDPGPPSATLRPAGQSGISQAFASAAAQTRSFTVRSPLSTVAMVRLPKNGSTISIGRSSKSCHVALSKSKLISRVHLKTRFDTESNMVIVECLGWNGVTVVVPTYTAEQLEKLDLSKGYPTAEGQSDYDIVKGQTIHVEYVPGITLDIRGERALIEVVDDDVNDETEDEVLDTEASDRDRHNLCSSPIINASDMNTAEEASKENTNPASFSEKRQSSAGVQENGEDDRMQERQEEEQEVVKAKNVEPVTEQETAEHELTVVKDKPTENKPTAESPTAPLVQKPVSEEKIHDTSTQDVETTKASDEVVNPKLAEKPSPAQQPAAIEQKPEAFGAQKTESAVFSNQPSLEKAEEPRFEQKAEEPRVEKKISNQEAKPVKELSKTPAKQKRPLEEVNVNENRTKRARSTSAAPSEKRAARSISREPEDVPEQPIEDIDQINNIVANHLAFSRLASTPISIIRKSNAMLGKLSRAQLKTILQNLPCVGVIPRSGKDAAGKPLEEEYYYAPEADDDAHRKTMVQQTRGGGLRSCRKTHKQYFWKKPAK
jgi:hypothetical protein